MSRRGKLANQSAMGSQEMNADVMNAVVAQCSKSPGIKFALLKFSRNNEWFRSALMDQHPEL